MDWEQRNLMNELKKGKEMAEELRNNFNLISSPEILVDKLLCSYEKALSMLNWNGVSSVIPNQHNGSKKRKMKEKYSEKVKVDFENGLEAAVDDGFSWRKYGQKDILGSKFPRGYYRCTHQKSQGCLAVKQVQRSDEDPSIFEVSYRGKHTCVIESEKSFKRNIKKPKFEYTEEKLEMEEVGKGFCIGGDDEFRRFPSFSFVGEGIPASFCDLLEVSPAASEGNYFSTTSSLNGVQTPESGLTDEIGFFQLNSDCSSSGVEFDFCDLDFDTNFTFDNLELH